MTITHKKENVLLSRTEVEGNVQFENATPSNNDIIGIVAKECKCEPAQIVINHIYTKFGQHTAQYSASVYSSTDARKKAVKLTSYQKKKMEEAAKKEAETQKAAGGQ